MAVCDLPAQGLEQPSRGRPLGEISPAPPPGLHEPPSAAARYFGDQEMVALIEAVKPGA